MTRLNYSDLPPEAQEAIKKLTGYGDEEQGEKLDRKPVAKPFRQSKRRQLTEAQYPDTFLLYLIGIPVILAAVWALAQMFSG